MKTGGAAIVIFLAACGGGKATDDLKAPPPGSFAALPEEKMSDADAGPVMDDADYMAESENDLKDLRQAFLACDSTSSKAFVTGGEIITIEIGSDGKVVSATPEGRSGLTDDIENCLRRVAMSAAFGPPPAGKKPTIKVPIIFLRRPLKARH